MLMPKHLIDGWIEENGVSVPLSNLDVERLAEYLQVFEAAIRVRLKMLDIATRDQN